MTFWTAEDVDLSRDPRDWQDRLEAGERSFVSSALGYLAASGARHVGQPVEGGEGCLFRGRICLDPPPARQLRVEPLCMPHAASLSSNLHLIRSPRTQTA